MLSVLPAIKRSEAGCYTVNAVSASVVSRKKARKKQPDYPSKSRSSFVGSKPGFFAFKLGAFQPKSLRIVPVRFIASNLSKDWYTSLLKK